MKIVRFVTEEKPQDDLQIKINKRAVLKPAPKPTKGE